LVYYIYNKSYDWIRALQDYLLHDPKGDRSDEHHSQRSRKNKINYWWNSISKCNFV